MNNRAVAKPTHERKKNEAYYTDERVALACVRYMAEYIRPDRILEPSVGGGAFVRACREVWPDAHITGVDVDPGASGLAECDEAFVGSFTEFKSPKPFNLVIGNPPFSLAAKHIHHAIGTLHEWPRLAVVAMLLPSSFCGGASTRGWFHEAYGAPLRRCTIHPRPSFTGGGTAAMEYELMVWSNAEHNKRGNTYINWKKEQQQ